MSTRTKRRLNKFADVLEAVAKGIINFSLNAVKLVLIDFTFGKGKYRKRGRQPRAPRQRTVYREVIRPSVPRVYVVKGKETR